MSENLVEVEQVGDNEIIEENKLKPYESFENMDLNENILRGIYDYGWEKPSEIQKLGIMPIINGKDVIAQARSGMGKTATFTIGMLQRIDLNLILSEILILDQYQNL